MRIISNFKDYYDVIQQYGQDEKIVFNRINDSGINFDNKALFNLPEDVNIDKNLREKINQALFYDPLTLKMLGDWECLNYNSYKKNIKLPKLHHMVVVINSKPINSFFITQSSDTFNQEFIQKNLTLEEVFEEFKNHCHSVKNHLDTYYRRNMKLDSFEDYKKNNKYWTDRFQSLKSEVSVEDSLTQLHKELNNPIVFIYNSPDNIYQTKQKYYTNLPLRYFGITNAFDSVELLTQEISYCLGNVVLNKNEPPIAIDDKHRILANGFDLKTSFRHRKQ